MCVRRLLSQVGMVVGLVWMVGLLALGIPAAIAGFYNSYHVGSARYRLLPPTLQR